MIGRFSALSCSNVVNIVSYYEGKAYHYIMMKNNGKINIDLVNTVETDEHNGVDVRVSNVYISRYIPAVSKLYYVPNLYLNSKLSCGGFNNRQIYRFNTFNAGSFNLKAECQILLGNVIYSLDLYKFREFCSNIRYYKNIFIHIEPKFTIGELDVTPNRESLMYTDKTIKAVTARLKEVIEELTAICQKQNRIDFSDFSDYYREVIGVNKSIIIGEKKIPIDGTFLEDIPLYTYKGETPLTDEELKRSASLIYNSRISNYIYLWERNVFKYKSRDDYTLIRLLYKFPSLGAAPYFKFLVLPSVEGTRSNYFKGWIEDHFPSNVPLFIGYNFLDGIRSLKEYISANHWHVINKDGTINWRKTLWVVQQIRKSLLNRSTITDIVNSEEYQNFKLRKRNEAKTLKTSSKFTKNITFYFYLRGMTYVRSFSDMASVISFINYSFPYTTKVYGCRDDYRITLGNDIYQHNDKVVFIAVAKTNIKFLKALPASYKSLSEFFTYKNKAYMKYMSERAFLKKYSDFYTILERRRLELTNLSRFLIKPEEEALNRLFKISYAHAPAPVITTALSLIDERYLDKSLYNCMSILNKYISILKIAERLEFLVSGINALYAYLCMKNKLMRMNYKKYQLIKSDLKVTYENN